MLLITEHTSPELLAGELAGWSRVSMLKPRERSALEHIICIEVRINDLRENDSRHESAYRQLDALAWCLGDQAPVRGFLVRIGKPSKRSLVRSYQGIFSRQGMIRKTDFHEEEIEIENQSFFIGVAEVNDKNKVEALTLAHDRFKSFLLFANISTAGLVSKKILKTLQASLLFGKLFSADWPKVVTQIVNDDQSLLVFGGDGGGGDWLNFRLFSHKSNRLRWLKVLKNCSNASTSV